MPNMGHELNDPETKLHALPTKLARHPENLTLLTQ